MADESTNPWRRIRPPSAPSCNACGRDHSHDARSAIACSVRHGERVPGLTAQEAERIAAEYEEGRQ